MRVSGELRWSLKQEAAARRMKLVDLVEEYLRWALDRRADQEQEQNREAESA